MSFEKMPELTSNESTLLINFIAFSDRNQMAFVNSNDIFANTREFGIRPIMLRATLDNLCKKSLLVMTTDSGPYGVTYYYEINPDYADVIESFFNFTQNSDYTALLSQDTPAADRFIPRGPHSGILHETMNAVDRLSASVQSTGALFGGTEQRLQISEEFDALIDILKKPKIHVSAIVDFAKASSTLKFLAFQTDSHTVQQDASALFEVFQRLIPSLTATP